MAQRFQRRYKRCDSRSVPRSHGMSHNERNHQHFHIHNTCYRRPGAPTTIRTQASVTYKSIATLCQSSRQMDLLHWHEYQKILLNPYQSPLPVRDCPSATIPSILKWKSSCKRMQDHDDYVHSEKRQICVRTRNADGSDCQIFSTS
jgi:hypothetical protein